LVFGFSQSACQKRRKDEIKSEAPIKSNPTAPQESMGALKLRAEAIGLEEPHEYQIKLTWRVSNPEPSMFFIVKRSDWNSGKVIQSDQGFFEDEEVQEGAKYAYQVQMLNGDRSPLSDSVEITVPVDKVFEEGRNVLQGKVTEYHRIFLKNRARVFWQGESLEITADEIISEDGVFESFSPDQKVAEVDEPGKSGGNLKITARSLKGSLYIKADGQNGGKGSQGFTGSVGEKGARGGNTFLQWGDYQKAPPQAQLWHDYYIICDPARPKGGQGGRGGKGGPGRPGQRGGNSGKVNLHFQELETGEVFFNNQPGLGGEGGAGGDGGPGGEGGEVGEIEYHTLNDDRIVGTDFNGFDFCAPVKGDQGLQGETGDVGSKGDDGFQSTFCMKLGDSEKGFCQ